MKFNDVRHATYVGEINGVAKLYFALLDDEILEDDHTQEALDSILQDMRTTREGNVLWDGRADDRRQEI
jgi:hypothetical protein